VIRRPRSMSRRCIMPPPGAIALTAFFKLPWAALGLCGAERHDIRQVRRPALHRPGGAAVGLHTTGGHFTPAMPAGSLHVVPFGLALVSVLWAFDGWADLSFVAGEVKDPRRTLPRALIGGTLAVVAIYLLANVAYLAVLPVSEIARSKLVAADVAERVLGTPGAIFVAATVVVSTFGTLNGSLLTSPRIFYAMGRGSACSSRRSVRSTVGSARRTSRSASRPRSGSPSCCFAPSSSWLTHS